MLRPLALWIALTACVPLHALVLEGTASGPDESLIQISIKTRHGKLQTIALTYSPVTLHPYFGDFLYFPFNYNGVDGAQFTSRRDSTDVLESSLRAQLTDSRYEPFRVRRIEHVTYTDSGEQTIFQPDSGGPAEIISSTDDARMRVYEFSDIARTDGYVRSTRNGPVPTTISFAFSFSSEETGASRFRSASLGLKRIGASKWKISLGTTRSVFEADVFGSATSTATGFLRIR